MDDALLQKAVEHQKSVKESMKKTNAGKASWIDIQKWVLDYLKTNNVVVSEESVGGALIVYHQEHGKMIRLHYIYAVCDTIMVNHLVNDEVAELNKRSVLELAQSWLESKKNKF